MNAWSFYAPHHLAFFRLFLHACTMDAMHRRYAAASPPPLPRTCIPIDGYNVTSDRFINGNYIGDFISNPATACDADRSCIGFAYVLPTVAIPAYNPYIGTGIMKTSISSYADIVGTCAYLKVSRKFDVCFRLSRSTRSVCVDRHLYVWMRAYI
jgi:hypothetical protein